MFTLMNFVVNNQELFQANLAMHSVSTRNRDHLHRPIANLLCFKKVHICVHHIFSSLLLNLRSFMN